MTRKKKVDLLKGIANGNRSISEIVPTTFDVWMCTDNKTYFNSKTGIRLQIDEFKKIFAKEKTIEVSLNIE